MAQEVITDKGLIKPNLAECLQLIGDALEEQLGAINREADSVLGQWIGVEAEANAVHFEALEYLWSSRFLSTATGFALDAIGQWIGITRRSKSATTVNAVISGSESTTVPAGTLAGFGNYQFKLNADAIISRSNLLSGVFRVTDTAQNRYSVRILGTEYSYNRNSSDTLSDIASALVVKIQQSGIVVAARSGSEINLTSRNLLDSYPVSLSEGLNWSTIGSPAKFTATQSGVIEVPVGGLNTTISAVTGWTGVSNLVSGATGAERESDTDYRARLIASRSGVSAAATISAIESRLLAEVEGVTLAHVIENHSMQEIYGMPPKSIQLIVRGGDEQAIADSLWKYKGAGIETCGQIRLTAHDNHGKVHDVQFSRPQNLTLYVKVVVNLLDGEETLSANAIAAIKQGVIDYIATLGLGDDLITQRIYGYIYANTAGIGKMTVTVSTDGKNFTESNIAVPETSVITLSEDNIEVNGV